jgi:hypothetical protein
MIEPRPHDFQTENHLIDDGYYWTKEHEASWDDLRAALDPKGGPLWENLSSSFNGLHDRVEEAKANQLDSSLRLIEVGDFKIVSVTDPVVERQYLAGKDGEFKVGHAILCVSPGKPYEGYAYKLIAGVFVKP